MDGTAFEPPSGPEALWARRCSPESGTRGVLASGASRSAGLPEVEAALEATAAGPAAEGTALASGARSRVAQANAQQSTAARVGTTWQDGFALGRDEGTQPFAAIGRAMSSDLDPLRDRAATQAQPASSRAPCWQETIMSM